jgi:hypothetical protein
MSSKRLPNAAMADPISVSTEVVPACITIPREKHIALATVAVLTLFAVPAHTRNPSIGLPKIIAGVEQPADSLLTLERAEMIAGQIFARIGLGVEWHGTGRSCPAASAQDRPFEISVLTRTGPDYFPGALGLCQPFDRIHGQVFYDRIRTTVKPYIVPFLLAHTLVHEITYLVQGTDWHAETGVMKARWDSWDFLQMARMQQLPFTDVDLVLIRFGLEARKGLLSSHSPMSSSEVAGR